VLPTWTELDEPDYRAIWDRFDARFAFRPDVEVFPGFDEPADSVTFSVSGMFGGGDRSSAVQRGCEGAFLHAARRLVAVDGFLYALDWQHPAYRFRPHGSVGRDEFGDWAVPLLPNGDYFCFLDPDFRFGTLGHPWEQTLCVFGAPLWTELEGTFTELLGPPIRRGGSAVRGV
jgi:hypothetical protein